MKLFLSFIASVLLMACSPSDNSPPANTQKLKNQKLKTRTVKETDTFNKLEENIPVDLANVSKEEDTADLMPVVEETQSDDSSEIVSMEEPLDKTHVVQVLDEEIVSLEQTEEDDSCDDQCLVDKIQNKYDDYIALHSQWEEGLAAQVEKLIEQATNPDLSEIIEPIRHTLQSEISEAPVTVSQIEDIEEQLSDEGVFIYAEDREDAKNLKEHLDKYINMLDTHIQLSIQLLELVEEKPDIMYAQTIQEEEQAEIQEKSPVIADTTQLSPEPILSAAAATPSIINTIPTNEEAAAVKEASDPVILEDTVEEENSDLVVMDTVTLEEAIEEDFGDIADADTLEEDDKISKEESLLEEKIEMSEITPTEETASNTALLRDAADVRSETEESWVDTISSWYSGALVWFDQLIEAFKPDMGAFVAQRLTANKLNEEKKKEIVEEELDNNSVQRKEAYQLIGQLMQNVEEFAKAHDVKSVEQLISYLAEIYSTPESERTAEEKETLIHVQTALLNPASQIIQNTNQREGASVTKYVEFSEYNTEEEKSLSQQEVVIIIEMLSNFDKEQNSLT